ncbi:MAG TPA: ABC transporter permease subunit [Acidimicrobiia bacterium]
MSATDIAQVELVPVGATGWRTGLNNLVRKEIILWWTTKLWWIQTVIWLVMLNGVTTVIMLDSRGMTADALAHEAVQTFFLVGATSIPIGIVLTLQGSIVGERELGTAAWVMSKPVSRVSFVLSKLMAHFTGFVATAVVIPSVVFLVTAKFLIPQPVELEGFAIGMAVMGLVLLFYVTLTLTLGCLFKGRGPVAGIGITLILVGQFFKGMLPLSLVMATPWLLGEAAASFPMQELPEFDRVVPLIAVGIEVLVLGFMAIWRFNREEF